MARRRALISAASLAGVVVAGVAAISASLGLLRSSDQGPIGDLSAEMASTRDVQGVVEEQAGSGEPQEFLVDVAGSVSLVDDDGILRLEGVSPTPGWDWRSRQSSATELEVELTDGTTTFAFRASLGADGTISARVDEVVPEPAAIGGSPAASGSQQVQNGDEDPIEHEAIEYEGGDEDD
jgi:hypothetical protein